MNTFKALHIQAAKLAIRFTGVLMMLALAVSVCAQGGSTGAISGNIQDPNGAAVPGATVEIINQQMGVVERTVRTNDDGSFTAANLPVGVYRLAVTATGFAKAEAPDIRVSVTETASVNINLKVGDVTGTVTVVDAATTVQLASATTGQALSEQVVGTLPLPTRNFLTLLTLSTGANTEMTQSDALGRGPVTINVNGQRPSNNNYQLEGINANDINLPVLDNVPLPNPQTVREFKTQTSLYDASQGRNGGGNIQVALKSGSNEFHGDVFEFFRNEKLNANDFFFNRGGRPRPVSRQNQYGFSIGGPIYLPRFGEGGKHWYSGKDKHFFFFNYQGTNAASGAAANTNFTTNLPILPTNRSEANLIATFFPAGLPAGRTGLDPVAVRLLNIPGSQCPFGTDFCIPSIPGTPGFTGSTLNSGTFATSGLGLFEDDQYVISIDNQLTSKHKLTSRYFNSINTLFQPFATGIGAPHLPFGRDTPATNRFLKLGLTSVLTSKLVNDFRAGFNRFTFALVPEEPISLADIGATRGNSGQFPGAYRFIVTGTFSINGTVNDDRGGAFNTFVLGDDVSYVRGNHTFRGGFEGSHYQLNRFNNFATRGSVTFGSFRDFLLGNVQSTQGSSGFSTFYFRATDYSAYFLDDWKVNSRLTLNLGVRWEGLSIAYEKFNFLTNLLGNGDDDPGPPRFIHPEETARVGTPGVSRCTMIDCFDGNNFAPRFGFAYDLFGDQKTVIRGGYGIYYQRLSNQSLLQTSGGSPFSEPVSATPGSVTPSNPFPTIRPASDFPLATDQQIPQLISFNAATGAPIFSTVPGVTPGAALGGNRFFPVRNFKAPYAQQFNFTIQRELFKNNVFEIGYVGSRGVSLVGTGNPLNPAQICTVASPCVIPASIGSGVTVPAGTPGTVKNADGSITITQSTRANGNARVPAHFMGLENNRLQAVAQDGQSTYHSMQTSLTRRYSDGIYYQIAYTWSKSNDNSSGSTFQDELNGLFPIGDLFSTRSNRALSDFDRTHRLVISYNYEIPLGRWLNVENRGFGKLVNGWSLNGVYTAQSGTPFLIFDNPSATVAGVSGTIPNGTLQDPNNVNGNNAATYIGGNIVLPGSTHDLISQYINRGAFLPGGFCVNNQNQIIPCTVPDGPDADSLPDANPAVQGRAIGNLGRNVFRGPFQTNWDMSFVKITSLSETTSLEFRTEVFNILNHPAFQSPAAAGAFFGNYGTVNVSNPASTFSSIIGTVNRPRSIQFALKLNF
ncbi:MAG: carboxypeptidase regulatory-like domain-containing protein [Pyrinomonadaceae bacterium]|nr:carboxypeptidase regulatory-like domain-containing protein [Pyrinomonadaceae bacterium]